MGLVAKRMEYVPHSEPQKVMLESLNPEHDSYERAAEEVRVVGRAVWGSRRLHGTLAMSGGQRYSAHLTSDPGPQPFLRS